MKKFQRIMSMLLTLVLVVSMIPFQTFAQETQSHPQPAVDMGDMTVEGTNGFGALLSEDLLENEDESEESDEVYEDGYGIVDLIVEGSTATVEYYTLETAIVMVAIYDESGLQMLASGKTEIDPDADLATVTIEGEMPEYFMAAAYLLDTYDYSPLCPMYDTPMYTQDMQELLASTVDDYDEELVLNLDDDKTTNFAVYSETTKIIEKIDGSLTNVIGLPVERLKETFEYLLKLA